MGHFLSKFHYKKPLKNYFLNWKMPRHIMGVVYGKTSPNATWVEGGGLILKSAKKLSHIA